MLDRVVNYIWYSNRYIGYILLPFSFCYYLLSLIRAKLFKILYRYRKLSKPSILVGNITVGGSGKTPLVAYLIDLLKKNDFNPAIVTKGYKGSAMLELVTQNSSVLKVGDEALMLHQATKVPVMVAKNRYQGAKYLLQQNKAIDVIVFDDGLQNYSIPRDIEISVIDGERKFGNKLLFPAGPLRESVSRLSSLDFTILNKSLNHQKKNINLNLNNCNQFNMSFIGDNVYNLLNLNERLNLYDFFGKKVTAVSAIGNNARFFNSLESQGLLVDKAAFLDHHLYRLSDLEFKNKYPIITTSKDAVKILELYNKNTKQFIELIGADIWVYPINAKLSDTFDQSLLSKLELRIQNG